jgi:hypothetical protein
MAKYLSDVASAKKSVPQPNDALVTKVPIDVTLPAVALAVGDIITLLDIPPGIQLADYDVGGPQLDSNGAPTLAFSIGVENAAGTDLATVYEANLTFGRTASGSISRASNMAAALADRTVARRISLKVTAAAATSASAGKQLLAFLHLRS